MPMPLGWKWVEFRQAHHPTFWVCDKGCKSGCGADLASYSHCSAALNGNSANGNPNKSSTNSHSNGQSTNGDSNGRVNGASDGSSNGNTMETKFK